MPDRSASARRRKKAPNLRLAEAIRRREGEKWLRRNRAALDAYNEHIEKHGAFSDRLRSF